MEPQYQITLLSHLFRQSQAVYHPDFALALDYIFARLDKVPVHCVHSEFNNLVWWIKRLPRRILIRLLYRFGYDAMMGFKQDEHGRVIYGMISFQKHPRRHMIGMFDIYITPENRDKDLVAGFEKMAGLVFELSRHFQAQGYHYLQCGHNDTTRRALKLFSRVATKFGWDIQVDVETSRLYLGKK